MAEFSVNIPDEQVARVVNALCEVGGYDSTKHHMSKREFARQVVIKYVGETVLQVERRRAMTDAMTSVTIDPVPID